jgi:putative PIN family toxin of toxin-antitoxin system
MPAMPRYRAVMDTNVLYAGLRSREGASFQLLRLLRTGQWTLLLSNTAATEYEEILLREATMLGITQEETSKLLDDLCVLAERWHHSGCWQPLLSDPDDEAFAQLASESKADYLVTHNQRHYEPIQQHGIRVVTPKAFLDTVRAGT